MPPASTGSVLDEADGVIRGMALSHRIVGDKTGAAFMEYMADLLGRLRLTDAEREAVVQSADFADWDAEYFAADRNKSLADGAAQRAATLRGLLERHGGLPDREHPSRKEVATPARSGETGDDSPERE